MFRKPVSQLSEADIQVLVENKEKESSVLEYKRELRGTDSEKKELSKDVSAIANAEGGFLIIGVDEQDGRAASIVGMPKNIGRQPVEEWIESVLIANIRPKLVIKPKVIPLESDPERVLVVIHIPQSARRPHMVIADGKNAYFRRHNFQSTYADEHEVRSMFLESKNVEDEMREFLADRHLADVDDSEFAMTPLARELVRTWTELPYRELPDGFEGRPRVIFSACPRYLEERVDIASDDFRSWLDSNQSISLFHLNSVDFLDYNKEISAESIRSIKDLNRSMDDDGVYRYVEISRNGYIEQGTGPELMWPHEKLGMLFQLTYFTAAFWLFVKFARAFYEKIGYVDEVVFNVALADVKGVILCGFGKKNKGTNWAEPGSFFHDRPGRPIAARQKNIKIERSVMASELSDERIEVLVKDVAKRISNAFGEQIAKCFDDDGNFNIHGTSGFRNIISR